MHQIGERRQKREIYDKISFMKFRLPLNAETRTREARRLINVIRSQLDNG